MTYSKTNLHKKILSHLVFLFDKKDRTNSSGVLVKISDRIFVLTAAHVITDDLMISLGLPDQITPFTILNQWKDETLDLGFLELKQFEADVLRRDEAAPYIISGTIQAEIPSRVSTLALCGFPTEFHSNADDRIGIQALYLGCALLHENEWPPFILEKGNKPENNFAILFGPKHNGQFYSPEGQPMSTFSPKGMSGCGLWLVDKTTEHDAKPQYSLIGIQHRWYPQGQLIVGSYADKLIDQIRREYNISF